MLVLIVYMANIVIHPKLGVAIPSFRCHWQRWGCTGRRRARTGWLLMENINKGHGNSRLRKCIDSGKLWMIGHSICLFLRNDGKWPGKSSEIICFPGSCAIAASNYQVVIPPFHLNQGHHPGTCEKGSHPSIFWGILFSIKPKYPNDFLDHKWKMIGK